MQRSPLGEVGALRTVAQVIGYVWLAWMAYVILGTVILYLIAIPGISSGGGVGPKLFVELLSYLISGEPCCIPRSVGKAT